MSVGYYMSFRCGMDFHSSTRTFQCSLNCSAVKRAFYRDTKDTLKIKIEIYSPK